MKRGRPYKNTWPAWAIKSIKEMGFSEDLLETAMKIGLKTIQLDAAQLIERRKSIDETWNEETITFSGSAEYPDQPANVDDLVERQVEEPPDFERPGDVGERSGQLPEDRADYEGITKFAG
jgi:hypothetical protein